MGEWRIRSRVCHKYVKLVGTWTMKSENGRELLSVKDSFREQEPHAGTRLQGGCSD